MRFSPTTVLFLSTASTLAVVRGQSTISLSTDNVHWGYFSKNLEPVLTIDSGDEVTVEMATHHACDDYDKMIKGDSSMEDLYASLPEDFQVSDLAGDGVHALTGPIYVNDAEPGDILKVEILDLQPRDNADGKVFGTNPTASWGYQARVNKADGKPFLAGSATDTEDETDEVVTIYEILKEDGEYYATPAYQFGWPVVMTPEGDRRDHIKYPTCVPHDNHGDTTPSEDVSDLGWTKEGSINYEDNILQATILVNFHIGCMGLAPDSQDVVDSTPPLPTGGNLDNKLLSAGTTMYYPVEVAGGLLSMGDTHAAQGNSELNGAGIETSVTGNFKISLIKQADFSEAQKVQDFPLGETEDLWIVHAFSATDYLETYASDTSEVYESPSLDPAMQNAFTQTRKWMMAYYSMTSAEATTFITEGVDFSVTQIIGGNWGIHATIPKAFFSDGLEALASSETVDKGRKSRRTRRRRRRLEGEADLVLHSDNVHWGHFSKEIPPVLTVDSGDEVVVEMATHHACDDYDLMIKGDAGMEDIFYWTEDVMNEPERGASGKGDGVHILTGPIFVNDAEPGDILKVEILDLEPRPNPDGKTFGSNAAAWWGFQARVDKADGTQFYAGSFTNTPEQNDELVTIYEIVEEDGKEYAVPAYQFEWVDITDPGNFTRDHIAYPGTCVPHDTHGDFEPSRLVTEMGWKKSANITYYDNLFPAKIPVNYHVGCMGLAPASHTIVDSIPPMPTGGNLDNKRIGVGTTMYYPVEVKGALLSMGDAHTAQGDSELDGTGIETSITGQFKISLIKESQATGGLEGLDFPLGETDDDWIVHGFTRTDYLKTFSGNPADIYGVSNVDDTMENAFTQTRKFIMAEYDLTEAEAWTFITQGVDFGITQLVDGNWGIHAVIPKSMLEDATRLEGDDGDGAASTFSFALIAGIVVMAVVTLW